MVDIPKVWLITGASSGLGLALAKAVLKRGDKAVLAARRETSLKEVEAAYSDAAITVALDITDADQRQAAVRAAVDRFDRIDVLANIAGRGSLGAAEEFSPEQLREQMEVNFFGNAELTRDVLPTMCAQGSGHILMLTSVGGLATFAGFGPYSASKFALEGWSEALCAEVAPLGIKVTLVEPGAFRTEFAGAKNLRPAQQLSEYRAAIEPIEQYLYGNDGKQPGDPAKAAELMIRVADHASPPLRLILGADAFRVWDAKLETMQAERVEWQAAGLATAFET